VGLPVPLNALVDDSHALMEVAHPLGLLAELGDDRVELVGHQGLEFLVENWFEYIQKFFLSPLFIILCFLLFLKECI